MPVYFQNLAVNEGLCPDPPVNLPASPFSTAPFAPDNTELLGGAICPEG